MGTMLQAAQSHRRGFRRRRRSKAATRTWSRRRPDVVSDIHRAYLAAGADIIETNTFGSHRVWCWPSTTSQDQAYELTLDARRNWRAQAADEFSTTAKPRFVAGSMGPTTKAITVTGGVTFPELVQNFYDQAQAPGGRRRGMLLVETCQDTRNIKAALLGIERLTRETGRDDSGDGLGHHRAHGHHAGRADRRRAVRLDRARRSAVDRAELRHRSGVHDGPHPHHQRDVAARASPAIRTPACRTKRASIWRRRNRWPRSWSASSSTAGSTSWAAAAAPPTSTSAPSRKWSRASKPRALKPSRASRLLFGHRTGGGRGEQPAADRGRAHQRDRLARCSRT